MAKKPARWTLQDAKAQFSEVVRRSIAAGPQVVTRHGDDAVLVVSARDYERLTQRKSGRSLAQLLAASPLADVELDFARPRESGRETPL